MREKIIKSITVLSVIAFWIGTAGVVNSANNIQWGSVAMFIVSGMWLIAFSYANKDYFEGR